MKPLLEEGDTIGFVIGAALIIAGVWMIYPPAAFLIAGAIFCFGAWSVMVRKQAERDRRRGE